MPVPFTTLTPAGALQSGDRTVLSRSPHNVIADNYALYFSDVFPFTSTTNGVALFSNTAGNKFISSAVAIDSSSNVTGIASLTCESLTVQYSGNVYTTINASTANTCPSLIFSVTGLEYWVFSCNLQLNSSYDLSIFNVNGVEAIHLYQSTSNIAFNHAGTGNISIGSTTMTSLFNVGSSGQFRINTSGIVVAGTWEGTAVGVQYGGTGDTSFTAYAPICGGTTTTAALQSASTGLSTGGFVLTSNGGSSLPSFQSIASGGAITGIIGDAGSVSPSSGNITISGGSTGLTTSGSGSTLDMTGILTGNNGGTGVANTGLTITLSGGSSGKILTSDSSGNGTWQNAAALGFATNDIFSYTYFGGV